MTDTIQLSAASPSSNAGVPAEIWPLRSAVAIERAITTCRMSGQMGLICGASGTGKTTAARAIVAALAEGDTDAHFVMMTRAADGLQPGMLRIARELGVYATPNMGSAEIYDALAKHIATVWRRGGVLVLDEAQFMSEALIDAIRNLSDELRGAGLTRGIVMVGTSDLAARIEGKIGGRAKHFEPLRGRLYLAQLDGLDAGDFEAIAARLGIPGPQAAKLVADVGAGRGGLHNVARLVATAQRLAGERREIALSHLRIAIQGLGVAA